MTPRFKVDFNEWLEDDIVLFSQSDVRKDVYGNEHFLTEGLRIEICEIDYDEAGNRDDLWASGYVTQYVIFQTLHMLNGVVRLTTKR